MTGIVHQALQPLRMQLYLPLRRKLADFWTWWTGELGQMLPSYLLDATARRDQKLFVEIAGTSVNIYRGSLDARPETLEPPAGSRAAKHSHITRDFRETVLLLPSDKVLVKPLALPLAAEENLREVLGFEMDQHTPLPADKVCYDFRVTGRSADSGTIDVELVFSPRAVVEEALGHAELNGLRPDVVTSRADDGTNLRETNLLAPEDRIGRRTSPRRLNLVLATICGLLLALAVALPIAQKNAAIRTLGAQVEAAASTAREGNRLRQDLETMAKASAFLAAKKRSDILAVRVIDEMSRLLPDDTWVNRLDVSDTEIQLQGQSTASSALIGIIESSEMFGNARFRSPVVQIGNSDRDRFHISADVVRDTAQ